MQPCVEEANFTQERLSEPMDQPQPLGCSCIGLTLLRHHATLSVKPDSHTTVTTKKVAVTLSKPVIFTLQLNECLKLESLESFPKAQP